MNAEIEPNYIGDYSDSFNAFDSLAFAYSNLGYSFDEIKPNLEQYIYDLIEDCIEGTPIVNLNMVFSRFLEILNEQSYIRKIQHVWERF